MCEVVLGEMYGLSFDFVYHNKHYSIFAVYRTHESDLDNWVALSHHLSHMNRGKTYVFIGHVDENLTQTINKTEHYLDKLCVV